MTSSNRSDQLLRGNCEPKERDKPWTAEDSLIIKDDFQLKATKEGKDDKNKRTEEKWNRKTVIQGHTMTAVMTYCHR